MRRGIVFPGQGAHYVGMGQSLYESCRCGGAALWIFQRADAIVGQRFLDICFSGPEEILTQTRICQPALFVHGCAAVELLRGWPATCGSENTCPDFGSCCVAFGLSLGELTALWAADAFDFDSGLRVVAERGRLMQKACEETDGAMLCLIGGTLDDVNALCDEADVEISNANCPGQIVVSGERKNIRFAFEIAAKMRFRRVLPLNVAGAYHSRLMEGASVEFGKFLRNIEIRTPKMDVLTNISGDAVRSAEDIRDALSRQIVSPVLFEKCCLKAMEMGVGEFLECGPGRTLSGIIKKISGEISTRNFDKIKDFNG